KRLEAGRFKLPEYDEHTQSYPMEWRDLVMMVEGIQESPDQRLRRLRLTLGRGLKSKAETWTLFLMNYPCFGHELLVNCSKCLFFALKKRGFSGVFCTQKATLVLWNFQTPVNQVLTKRMSQCNNVTCNNKGEGGRGAAVKGIPMEDGRWKM
ncbi:MAG: transposase, partial [Bacteroidaceae bacterium]|nr:transposase [Bacteroidaceae bacterium]